MNSPDQSLLSSLSDGELAESFRNIAGYPNRALFEAWPVSQRARVGAAVLDAVHAFVGRFVSFPSPESLDAVVLWAALAHMVPEFHTAPRLAMLSPEPECGKSRVLELLNLLTPNAMLIISPSVAAIFRKLAKGSVTLLFDEVDAIFTKRGKEDSNEDLRALLNAGYRRGASIPRCVGPKHDVQDFQVFAATALAGIGDLPETIMTRAIVIRMRRRSSAEIIEQFRLRVHEEEGHALRDQLGLWSESVGSAAGTAWPNLPEGIVDRKAEAWEPLIAVADAAGGGWPERARRAAVTFVSCVSPATGMTGSLGIRLLSDLRTVFGARDAVSTEELLRALIALDESPWGNLRGHELDARGLAMRLKHYGIASRQVRIGDRTAKGYRREDLHDSWVRYLPTSPLPLKETRETSALDLTPSPTSIEGETRETLETGVGALGSCDAPPVDGDEGGQRVRPIRPEDERARLILHDAANAMNSFMRFDAWHASCIAAGVVRGDAAKSRTAMRGIVNRLLDADLIEPGLVLHDFWRARRADD